MPRRFILLLLCAAAVNAAYAAKPLTDEYALILDEPPLAKDGALLSIRSATVTSRQTELTRELMRRSIPITGSTKVLVNAIYVRLPPSAALRLSGLPGVRQVVWLPPMRRHLNDALGLVQVTAAWNNPKIGGVDNAGSGVKIGIIDTGIDNLNPAFSGSGLSLPPGYPKGETAYTNNKIIASRSYVQTLSSSDPQYSSPDDITPVDRVGHGTAIAMIAAGATVTGPAATITGVAPGAWLGNYKIFGSPGINDFTSSSAVIEALEDAATDGMNIVTLSAGFTPLTSPLDVDCTSTGTAIRSYIPATACDIRALAVENAVNALGMVVVVSAGDDGDSGNVYPTLGTINSPGTAPSAITVGATTNAHTFVATVYAQATGLTSALTQIDALFGSGPKPSGPVTAPLFDITKTGDDGLACSPLPANSLTGSIALVERGTCDFATKVNNVQAAGGIATILYLANSTDALFVPTNLANTSIPTVLIDNASGAGLKAAADNTTVTVTLDPALFEEAITADQVASFSSRGPSIGLFAPTPVLGIKPEIAAPGSTLYTITQTLDPNGDYWDATGFNAGDGTSFAAPLVAGAVALVKQANPGFTPAQLKSAVVNTATENVLDSGQTASVNAVGAGKLDAADAVNVALTCVPSTLSFGLLNGFTAVALPTTQSFSLTNVTSAPANVSVTLVQRQPNSGLTLTSPPNVSIPAGQSALVVLQLAGSVPAAGSYEGEIRISGAGPALHVPYLYLVTDGNPAITFPVIGDGLINSPGSPSNLIGFRTLDQYGSPLSDASTVNWFVDAGTGAITSADSITDEYGIALAQVTLGSQLEDDLFEGDLGNVGWQFLTTTANAPQISAVVNGGNSSTGSVAPGSYITIYGTDLSATSSFLRTTYLPPALAATSVSFDVPSAGISVPGALSFAGPNQINVQVPWELSGQNSAILKVDSNYLLSFTQTINLSPYSPAFFEFYNPATNLLIPAALDYPGFQLVYSAHPVARGAVVILYANGLGPVTQPQASGYPASGSVVAYTTAGVTVKIGGVDAPVSFSGLAPGYVGLYQINATVPTTIGTGPQSITVSVGGVTSADAQIYVQ